MSKEAIKPSIVAARKELGHRRRGQRIKCKHIVARAALSRRLRDRSLKCYNVSEREGLRYRRRGRRIKCNHFRRCIRSAAAERAKYKIKSCYDEEGAQPAAAMVAYEINLQRGKGDAWSASKRLSKIATILRWANCSGEAWLASTRA